MNLKLIGDNVAKGLIIGLLFIIPFCYGNNNGICTSAVVKTVYSTQYSTSSYYYVEAYTYSCGWFGWTCDGYRSRVGYKQYSYLKSMNEYSTEQHCCPGYVGNVRKGCKPICDDECIHGYCDGPLICACDSGWTGELCETDIAECLIGNGGCAHDCTEFLGSYACSCKDGYRLKNDSHLCEDVDECAEGIVKEVRNDTLVDQQVDSNSSSGNGSNNLLWCGHFCNNTIGGYKCECDIGYFLDDDNSTCLDINECLETNKRCGHNCHNTNGSYYCTCDAGFFLLEDKSGCTDHDECSGSNDCDHFCHNAPGSYLCSCDEGYKLDGLTSCIDIDECSEGISGCSDICNNTIGSYYCSCFSNGYKLFPDNDLICQDIDECQFHNGGCSHSCINLPGLYKCECKDGYSLSVDSHTCYGDPCPYMEGPSHGSIQCTGPQVTDGICNFKCDPGYLLSGSSSHTCQPNHTWSGEYTECQPMECSQLIAPANALIVFPCSNTFKFICTIACKKGYHVTNTSDEFQWKQTCILDDMNQTVQWTKPQTCSESDPCSNNPCGPGTCSVDLMNQIKCNCAGTNHIGERCGTPYINVSPIKLLSVNDTVKVTITSSLSDDRMISINSSNPSGISIKPKTVALGRGDEDNNYRIMATHPGIYRVKYSINPSENVLALEDSIVMVSDANVQGETDYSDIIAIEEGVVDPGCCSHVYSEKSKCLSSLSFSSSCNWISPNDRLVSSNGVIFVGSKTINLPLSISGVNISSDASSLQSTLLFEPSDSVKKNDCLSCSKQQSIQCTSIDSDVHDTRTFLSRNSLIKMLLSRIKHFFPSWFSIIAWPSIETPSYSVYDYISSLVIGNDLRNIPSCDTLDIYNKEYLYYVFRTRVPLQIMIDSFNTFLYPSPACIAIDLCTDNNPRVYFNVPSTLQPSKLVNLKYFQDFLSKADHFRLKTFIIAGRGINQAELIDRNSFWNGNEYISLLPTSFEFQVTTELTKLFIGGDLTIRYIFEGSAFHTSTLNNNSMVPGMLKGNTDLEITTVVGESDVVIQLSSIDEDAIFSFPETSVSERTILPPGISLKLQYNNSLSLPLSEIHTNNQICSVDGFLSVNGNFDVNEFSFTSDCLHLRIGQINIPNDFTHAIHFTRLIRNSGIPSVIIYSKLKSSKVSIGDFFHIYADHNDNIIELLYKPNSTSLMGSIYNVSVSLFDAEMKTDLIINGSAITFKGKTTIFNNFDVDVSGKSSIESSIESQTLDVSFEIVDRHSTFKKNLTENLILHMKTEYDNIIERKTNSKFLLHDTKLRLSELTKVLQNLDVKRQILLVKQSSMNESVNSLNIQVETFKKEFDRSYNQALGTLNSNESCFENTCKLICDHDTSCSSCESKVKVNEPAVCERNLTGIRITTQYRNIPTTLSRYESRCYPCSKLFWNTLPVFSLDNCCYTQSVSYIGNITEPYESTEYYSYIQKFACTTVSNVEQDVSGICCTERACSSKTLNSSCLVLNSLCRQQILNELISTYPDLQLSYEKYEIAKTNLTNFEIQLLLTDKQIASLDQEYSLIRSVEESLSFANMSRKTIQSEILKYTARFLPLYDPEENRIKDIEILNVSFTYLLSKQTPLSVPALVIINYDHEISELPVEINFQESLEIMYRQVSLKIFNHVAEIGNSRNKRETVQSLEDNYLSTVCRDLSNLEIFIVEVTASLNSSLHTFIMNMELLREGMSSNLLQDLSNTNGETSESIEELQTSLLELVQFKNYSLNRIQEILTDLSFMQWQMSIDKFYANGTVIMENGIPCIGLADCLQSVIYNLVFILEDTRIIEANSLKKMILSLKDNLLSVASKSNFSFMLAEQALNSLLDVFVDIHQIEYWCANPPMFTEQLPLKINVSLGTTLEIPCMVHSELPVTYLWSKNSIILSSSSSTLAVVDVDESDSGQYQCIATNSIGSVTSITTLVNVFSIPVLSLTLDALYEVYEGYDNGVHFACDAESFPLPGWKWFYQFSMMDPLSEINGETGSTLSILSPELHHEGWYTCMAHNELGETSSKPAFLLVLPSTLSTFQYIVNIAFTSNNEELDYDIVDNAQSFTSEVQRLLESFTQITVDNLQLVKTDFNLLQVTFTVRTYDQLDSLQTRTLIDIVPVIRPIILQLEDSISTLSYMASASTGITINIANMTLNSIFNSLQIEPRYVSCPEGFEVSSNYIICVGCKPGEVSGGQSIEFIDIGNGKYIEQTIDHCISCPIGEYQYLKSQSLCNYCPENTSTAGFGSSSSNECLPLCLPHTVSESGLYPCVPCPPNYYQPQYGKSICIHQCTNDFQCSDIKPMSTEVDVSTYIALPTTNATIESVQDSAGLIVTISAAATFVIIVLIMVVTCLVILFTVMIKRSKPSQSDIRVSNENQSIELNSYDKADDIKANDIDNYYNCKTRDLGEEELPYDNIQNEPIYEYLEVGTTDISTEIKLPELPPRENEYAEPLGLSINESDYMPMDLQTIDVKNDYDEIRNVFH